MQDTKISKLEEYLFDFGKGNRERKVLLGLVRSLLRSRSCQIHKLAELFNPEVLSCSNARRIRRYLDKNSIDEGQYVRWVLSQFVEDWQKIILSMDRTEWKVGHEKMNVLCIGLSYEGGAIPLVWMSLEKNGPSYTHQRIALLERLLGHLSAKQRDQIWYLCADREFLGIDWLNWLDEQQLLYVIRVRQDITLSYKGVKQRVSKFFEQKSYKCLKGQGLIYEKMHYVAGYRQKKAQGKKRARYFILLSNAPLQHGKIWYFERWNIEVLFGHLKSKGFGLTDCRMRQGKRVESLLQVMSLAYCWLTQWREKLRKARANNRLKRLKAKRGTKIWLYSWFRVALDLLAGQIARKHPFNLDLFQFVRY